MAKDEAEKVATDMRAAGWRHVTVKVDDLGRWSAVGEDYDKQGGWLSANIRRRRSFDHLIGCRKKRPTK